MNDISVRTGRDLSLHHIDRSPPLSRASNNPATTNFRRAPQRHRRRRQSPRRQVGFIDVWQPRRGAVPGSEQIIVLRCREQARLFRTSHHAITRHATSNAIATAAHGNSDGSELRTAMMGTRPMPCGQLLTAITMGGDWVLGERPSPPGPLSRKLGRARGSKRFPALARSAGGRGRAAARHARARAMGYSAAVEDNPPPPGGIHYRLQTRHHVARRAHSNDVVTM